MNSNETDLNEANPHALAAIVEASAKRSIVASEDILDERGVKLWARGQPVSESLQQRLLERKLRQPLEASLQAADGVSGAELKAALEAFFSSEHVMAAALKPWAPKLVDEVAALPLHSVAQLLLTALQASRAGAFDHAVRGMALAGAIALSTGADAAQLRLALLGGLLHDLGEIYVNPDYLNPKQPLDLSGYRHVAVHPRIGAVLLTRLASDYPPALARAIGEHHERLDGTGYPGRLSSAAISPLGRLLAVVEVTLGVAAAATAPWAHASFALRVVPGEFDGAYVGFVAAASRQADEDLGDAQALPPKGLSSVNDQIGAALAQAFQINKSVQATPAVRAIAERAGLLLFRLRTGWNAMGLWSADSEDASLEARFEIRMAGRELAYRMRFIRRECLWAEKELSDEDALLLAPLWMCLEPVSAVA